MPSQSAGDTGGLLSANRLNAGLFAIVATLWIGALSSPDLATCAYDRPQWALGYIVLRTSRAPPPLGLWLRLNDPQPFRQLHSSEIRLGDLRILIDGPVHDFP